MLVGTVIVFFCLLLGSLFIFKSRSFGKYSEKIQKEFWGSWAMPFWFHRGILWTLGMGLIYLGMYFLFYMLFGHQIHEVLINTSSLQLTFIFKSFFSSVPYISVYFMFAFPICYFIYMKRKFKTSNAKISGISVCVNAISYIFVILVMPILYVLWNIVLGSKFFYPYFSLPTLHIINISVFGITVPLVKVFFDIFLLKKAFHISFSKIATYQLTIINIVVFIFGYAFFINWFYK